MEKKKTQSIKEKKKLSRIQETAQHHFLHRLVVFRLESHIFCFFLVQSILPQMCRFFSP
jgi:hypothetical protein